MIYIKQQSELNQNEVGIGTYKLSVIADTDRELGENNMRIWSTESNSRTVTQICVFLLESRIFN